MRTDPNVSDVRAALNRVTASPAFEKSNQLASFLRYVVEEALAGRGERLKAYTIATAALGRDNTFDPQIDPIVRVEAGRLRRALKAYYADEGRNDAVVISLPVGQYTPVFLNNAKRHGFIGRLRHAGSQLSERWARNRRLVILIVVIAAVVSVTLNLAAMVFTQKVLPAFSAQSVTRPALAQPDTDAPAPR